MRAATRQAKPRWLAPEVVQTSAMDCGPAALKCLLEGFHIPVSYGRLREACQTDVDGTSIDTIEVVANQLGVRADQLMVPLDHLPLSEADVLPAIVVVRHSDGATHFVVVWRRHGQWLQVMDPAVGRRWVSCKRFAEEVFEHSMNVPAVEWRDWAATDEFLKPLAQQLRILGASPRQAKALMDKALADPLWFGLAALDASARFVRSVIQSGGLKAGEQAYRLTATLLSQTTASTNNIFKVIPPVYWSAAADQTGEDGRLQLKMSGAVLLRIRGHAPEEEQAVDPGLSQFPTIQDSRHMPDVPSAALSAALNEKPDKPLQVIRDLLKLEGRLGPIALLFAVAVSAAVVLVEMLLFRGLFDIAWALGLPSQRIGALLGLGALIVLLMLIEIPVVTESMRMGRHLEVRLRMALLAKLPLMSDRYFQSRPVSDMADRSHNIHVARQIPAFGLQFVQLMCDLLFTLIGIALIDMASLPLALVVVLAAIGIPLAVQNLLNERDLRVRSHAGALHVFNLDALQGLVPIRTHRAEQSVRNLHEGLLAEWARSSMGLIRMSLSAEALQSFVCTGLVAWLLLAHFMHSGGANGGDLLLVFWALKLPALGTQLSSLAHRYAPFRNVLLRLLEPLSSPEEANPSGSVAASAASRASKVPCAIQIRAGKVRAGGHTILEDVNLQIAPGEHVAIVGSSGAGKSTLLGLLLGWHRLSEGRLDIDGRALSGQAQQNLRRSTAWVDPSVQLWNQTFFDNLTYACEQQEFKQMSEVLEKARLRQVLQKLPEGLQTWLGEGGALLSGGEGQRVRLARALMQSDVRLALLDEPFRGLDRSQRMALMAEARIWWKNATLLCVTHDVAETLNFKRVLVVENGRIVEDGSPASLAGGSSRYRELLEVEQQVRERLWSGEHWRRIRIEQGMVVEGGKIVAPESRT